MVLHGAPINTLDLDLVYRITDDNLTRLLQMLEVVNAHFSDLTGRRLRPTRQLLLLPSPKLLRTDAGRLDLLGELHPDISWQALSLAASQFIVDGIPVKVASLAHLVLAKERAGRPKDQLHLLHLRALLTRHKR